MAATGAGERSGRNRLLIGRQRNARTFAATCVGDWTWDERSTHEGGRRLLICCWSRAGSDGRRGPSTATRRRGRHRRPRVDCRSMRQRPVTKTRTICGCKAWRMGWMCRPTTVGGKRKGAKSGSGPIGGRNSSTCVHEAHPEDFASQGSTAPLRQKTPVCQVLAPRLPARESISQAISARRLWRLPFLFCRRQ